MLWWKGVDLLPYEVAADSANSGAASLALTVGDNGGWPAIPGDFLLVAGGSGTALPTGVADSRGTAYTTPAGTATSPASWMSTGTLGGQVLRAPGPGVTADTVTATWAGTGQAKQVIVMGCQGIKSVDAAVGASASGSSAAPSVTTGTPGGQRRMLAAVCLFQTGATTITWPPGWHEVARITSGSNPTASLAVLSGPSGSSPVTVTPALDAPTGWSMTVIGLVPAPSTLRGRIGASIFKAAYSDDPAVNTNEDARTKHDAIVGRKEAWQGCKRYLNEDSWETAANPYQQVVQMTKAGILCMVSVKPQRAVGGGTTGSLAGLRTMLTYWKNNGVAPQVIVWNECSYGGQHSPFGDGTTKGVPDVYGSVSEAQAASNYKQYFGYYGTTVVAAGLQCFYNPFPPSGNNGTSGAAQDFLPDRLAADGWPLCTGVAFDLYMSNENPDYPVGSNNNTIDPLQTLCDTPPNGAWPPYPFGWAEAGASSSSAHNPLVDNPGAVAKWMDAEMTARFSARLAAQLVNLPIYWFANGLLNDIDTDTSSKIVAAFGRVFDALDPSTEGANPTIATGSLPGATQGTAYSATVTATGGTGPGTYSWSASGLPGGLTIGSSTGTISGTPTAAGPFTVVVTVTDANTNTDQASFPLTVAPSSTGLTITTHSPLPTATQGAAYSDTLTIAGGTAPYSWSAAGLPAGLTIAPSTGIVSGTPTVAGPSFAVTVTVTDSSTPTVQQAQAQLALSVTAAASPTITTQSLPAGTLNGSYTATLTATGGTGTLTWAAAGLPAGVACSTDGSVFGAPTASGAFLVTVTVADSLGNAAQAQFPLKVLSNAPQITTTALPPGQVGIPYSQKLSAGGGTPGYTWAITFGQLPAGMTLDPVTGVIAGTPTQPT